MDFENAPVLDAEAVVFLKKLGEPGDLFFWPNLAASFVKASERAREELGAAVLAKDWKAVRRLAHSLKGSSANMGAVRLESVCEKFRESREDELANRAAGLMRELEREVESVRIELAR